MFEISLDPINRNAYKVFSEGEKHDVVLNEHKGYLSWETCPPLKNKFSYSGQLKVDRLVGKRKGNFTIKGVLLQEKETRKALWVVRCDCGLYEVRTHKSLNNLNNVNDSCRVCNKRNRYKLEHANFIKRCKEVERKKL